MPKFCIINPMKTTSSSKIFVIVLSLIIAVSALAYGAYRVYENEKPVDVAVELTDAQRADYEAKVADYSAKINDPTLKDANGLPNSDFYIEKARYLGYLGHLSQAVDVLKDSLDVFKMSSVAEHNLAKFYEQMGKYDDAVDNYERLADETIYNMPQYYFDIARVMRIQKNVAKADAAYHKFLAKFNTPDAEFEKWLQDNKK